MAVGEEILPLQDGAQALTLDVDDIIARERARRRAGLRSIPIVAADSSVAPA
jgi:hypothetical protein